RHDESSVGTRAAGKPMGREAPRAAAVQDHVPRGSAAASVPRPRDLYAGPGTSADLRQVRGRRRDRDPAVPRACGTRAVLLERLGRESARARRFLRPAFQHSINGAGEDRSREFPERALMRGACLIAAFAFVAGSAAAAPPAPGDRISFVSCPIVRDTRTVPCWLSEYDGETYYLTIQSDVSAAVQPPMLGHQVLVEGVVSDAAPICGG